jgi:hypothetical protein
MKHLIVLIVLSVLLIFCAGANAQAQWSTNSNINNAICTAAGGQQYPTIASDGSGGAIITWFDQRTDGGDIYAQRISASGVAQWTANGVAICTATGTQEYPTIISDGAGGAIITWQDLRADGGDIYAQRVNASGAVQWTANGVAICTAAYDQDYPAIVSDGSGGAIITWEDFRNNSYYNVYAQRVSASGVVQWTANGVALSPLVANQQGPTIASDGSGGAIITWFDGRNHVDYDIYAQRVNPSGALQWTSAGAAICTATGNQQSTAIVSDGAGGAIIAWDDPRSDANGDIYAQRVNASGAGQWTTNGIPICTATNSQDWPTIVSDGSGGAIIAWDDYRNGSYYKIYAQGVSSSGVTEWAANGVALSTTTAAEFSPTIVSDMSGGAIITWQDFRNGNNWEIYAQWFDASGAAQWATNGVAIATASGVDYPTIASDGSGGAIITWEDYRSGSYYNIYAQNVDRNGYLGDAAPVIQAVKDVPNDQGGFVNVMWTHSYLDTWNSSTISSYTIWRGVTPTDAAPGSTALDRTAYYQAMHEGGATDAINKSKGKSSVHAVAAQKIYLKLPRTPAGSDTIYWDEITTVSPHGLTGYSYPAPTLSDSTPLGIPWYYFMVTANTSNSSVYWDSAPDSGYSVDNLPPGAVQSVAAQIQTNLTVDVQWAKDVVDPDVGYYEVHRSATSGFTPSSSTKIGQTSDTLFVDSSPINLAVNYYRVITVDIHGNKSVPSVQASTGAALSIEVSALTASLQSDNNVKIDWTTTSETNTYGFYVQRQVESSTQWTTVSPLIPGAGTSLEQHDYTWTDNNVPQGVYYYRLEQVDNNGAISYTNPIKFVITGPLGVKGDQQAPLTFELEQNYPNPFNPTTSIQYALPQAAYVSLKIYNVLGLEVATLVNGEQSVGYKSVQFDATNLPSGVYVYRIEAGTFSATKKLLLMK